jgi:hypothetical protein
VLAPHPCHWNGESSSNPMPPSDCHCHMSPSNRDRSGSGNHHSFSSPSSPSLTFIGLLLLLSCFEFPLLTSEFALGPSHASSHAIDFLLPYGRRGGCRYYGAWYEADPQNLHTDYCTPPDGQYPDPGPQVFLSAPHGCIKLLQADGWVVRSPSDFHPLPTAAD